MVQNDSRIAFACWFGAGIPILASFVQAVFALVGIDALDIPVVGTLKETLDTVEVLDVAGVVFRGSDTAVLVLFVLVALSWLAIGGTMFLLGHRQGTYAASGLVTLFLVLFLLVYSPLFFADVPLPQVLGFVSIPLVVVGVVWVGVSAYPWSETVDAETASVLSATRDRTNTALQTFQGKVGEATDEKTLEWVQHAAPEAVEQFEQDVEEFERHCEDLLSTADDIAEGHIGSSSRERLQRAQQLLDEAASLEPNARAEQLLETLRNSLAQQLRDEFAELRITSRYGETYAVRNFREFAELDLRYVGGPPVQIGGERHELGERLGEAATTGVPLADLAQAVNRATDHIDQMEREITAQEDAFQTAVEETESELDGAREALSRMDDRVAERLREILFEGRFGDEEPPFPTAPDIRRRLEAAKEPLHACKFDQAISDVRKTAHDADRIKSIATFVADSVIPTVEHGSGSIPIPDDVGQPVVGKLRPEMTRVYDITYEVENGRLEIGSNGDDTPTEPRVESTDQERQRRSSANEAASEDVLYLLRELQNAAMKGEGTTTATLQLGEYPEKFADSDLTEELATFCERQSDVDHVELPEGDPGYLKFVVDEDSSARAVLEDVTEQYREQYA